MEVKEIVKIYNNLVGMPPERVEKLAGAGSSRRYYRVYSSSDRPHQIPATMIATVGDDVRENLTFVRLALALSRKHVADSAYMVPEIFAVSENRRVYLQSDFGDRSLFSLIADWRKGIENEGKVREMVRRSIEGLVELQTLEPSVWEDECGYGIFDAESVMFDLNYFKYCFLKPAGITFDELKLERDFKRFSMDALDYDAVFEGLMYRDFQSRNIIIPSGNSEADSTDGVIKAGFIDFQSARRGPIFYDIMSLLWQAKAGFSREFRQEMLQYYLECLSKLRDLNLGCVPEMVGRLKLLRTLQVLGAYGFRGLVERKSHFLESIAAGIGNLKECLEDRNISAYPELESCCRRLVEDEKWAARNAQQSVGLRIEVFSFSYKKGYPEDLSGNGGGFMFDCRGMHNPGRYDEYKPLTGLDEPVIEFLEQQGEVQDFLEHSYAMVDHSVETYLRRGFTNLQVGFGCTGGRHRSVYCAEHMASHLAEKYPCAVIELWHRERRIRKVLNRE